MGKKILKRRLVSGFLSFAVTGLTMLSGIGGLTANAATAYAPTDWNSFPNTFSNGDTIDISGMPVDSGNISNASQKTVTFNGVNVTLIGKSTTTYKNLSIIIAGGAQVTIDNVNIDDSSWSSTSPLVAGDSNSGNTLYFESSNTLKGGSSAAGINVSGTNALTFDKPVGQQDNNCVLTATGGSYGAGIGGAGTSGGVITINGGTITANGNNSGAGVGGGGSNGNAGAGGTIIINQGTLNATGGYNGAGIGGGGSNTGYAGGGGTIAINNGTVTATGGDGGAGIGCGSGYNHGGSGGNITISGGSVTATGCNGGAGIGGAYNGPGGNITISGGTVHAATNSGAGIGGGSQSSVNQITISGGIVTASSGNSGAGIGGGNGYSGGTITINGGTVTALSDSNYYNIGGDYNTNSPNIFTGGSINALYNRVHNSPTNGTVQVCKTTIQVNGISAATPVTYSVDGGSAYPVYTDTSGNLYLWLTVGSHTVNVNNGGANYIANGTVTTDNNIWTAEQQLNGSANIAGTLQVGQQLTAVTASVTGSANLHYQWKSAGTDVGTDSVTYTVVSGDAGKQITCVITATDATGSVTATASGSIELQLGGTATINGTLQVGQQLTIVSTSVTGSTNLHYQWKSAGTDVGTDSDNYTVASGDAGKLITCVITATDATGSVTATPSGSIEQQLGGTATINGALQVGLQLTAVTASVTGSTNLHYHWKSAGTDVGTDSATYTVVSGDVGKLITCVITATDATGSVTATASGSIEQQLGGSAAISGTLQVGQQLTVLTTSVTGSASLHYQWKSAGTDVGTDSATYSVASGDAGKQITCVITATDASGSVTATASGSIEQQLGGTATINGTLQVGRQLTAVTTLVIGSTNLHYQWKSAGTDVGTDSTTYTVVSGDLGKQITCVITATDATGSVTAAATGSIEKQLGGTATINGTLQVGQQLTVVATSVTDSTNLHYQWKSAGTDVGTDTTTYTVVSSDAGKQITCVITATDATGSVTATASTIISIPLPSSTPTSTSAPVVIPTPTNSTPITGTATTNSTTGATETSATITSTRISSVTTPNVSVDLGYVQVTVPASVVTNLFGGSSIDTLLMMQAASPAATQAAENKISTINGVTPVVSFDINLYRANVNGTLIPIHQFGGTATITIQLTAAQTVQITDHSQAALLYYDPRADTFTNMHATFDFTNRTATFTSTHLSTFVIAVVDNTAPVITGVSNNGVYKTDKTITFNRGTATLDGSVFTSGSTVSVEGKHTLTVTDVAGSITVVFTIDKTAPVITGVSDNGVYSNDKTITFNEGTATLDDGIFISGSTVSTEGAHTLTITDAAGNITTVAFVIAKSAPRLTVKAGNTAVKIGGISASNVTITASDPFDLTKIAILNGKAVAWPSNECFTKDGKYIVTVKDPYGHSSTVTFTIDKTAPKIIVKKVRGGVSVSVTEANLSAETVTLNGKKIVWAGKYTKKGNYIVNVSDKAGHKSVSKFKIA